MGVGWVPSRREWGCHRWCIDLKHACKPPNETRDSAASTAPEPHRKICPAASMSSQTSAARLSALSIALHSEGSGRPSATVRTQSESEKKPGTRAGRNQSETVSVSEIGATRWPSGKFENTEHEDTNCTFTFNSTWQASKPRTRHNGAYACTPLPWEFLTLYSRYSHTAGATLAPSRRHVTRKCLRR